MDEIQKLIELRDSLFTEYDKLLEKADEEKRDLSEDEEKRCKTIQAELKKTGDKLADLEAIEEQRKRQAKLKADLDKNGIKRHYHTGVSEYQEGERLTRDDEKNISQFSFVKFLRNYDKLDGIERELDQEAKIEARHAGVSIEGKGIPYKYLSTRSHRQLEQRDQTVGTAGNGGNLVATELRGFIPALRDRLTITQMGATFLTGLVGDLTIPRQTNRSTPTEAAENAAAGEETLTFDLVSLSPTRLPATSDISKQLMIQDSPDIERLVVDDLQIETAIRIQNMAINGSASSSEPRGILNVVGIGDVVGGTNGAAPDRDDIVDLETAVAIDNADIGNLAYFTNAAVRGKLRKTLVDSGSGKFVWPEMGNMLLNYPAYVSNTVPSDLDKGSSTGVCSAILFGNWADLLIGQWGGLDIVIDPYSKATTGLLVVTTTIFYDVAVRHPESFAAMQDALTA